MKLKELMVSREIVLLQMHALGFLTDGAIKILFLGMLNILQPCDQSFSMSNRKSLTIFE